MNHLSLHNRIQLSVIMLLLASLACTVGNTASEEVPIEPGEVITVVVTATFEPTPEGAEASPTAGVTGPSATLKQDLNVRFGPGTAYDIKDQLPGGTVVEIIGRNSDSSWWLISYFGKSGWVSAPFTISVNTENVPVVSVPPPAVSNAGATPNSNSGGVSQVGGGSSAPSDSDIKTEVNIKNGNTTQNGEVSYPTGDTTDNVYIKPVGFDSVTTSGKLIFSLSCNGGTAKVTYTGGSVTNGSPACNKTWTVFVTNVSADSRVKIYLDSTGYVTWTLIVSNG